MDEERLSDFNRFVRLINIGDREECWEWVGTRPSGAYGHFSIKAKAVKAHRWVYELCCGPIPEGMVIRHKCDNPSCVNPLHLTVGTHQDNINDRQERRRWADRQGEKHPLRKVSEADVHQIRRAANLGEPQKSIAQRFGIGSGQVGKIVRRENWSHI